MSQTRTAVNKFESGEPKVGKPGAGLPFLEWLIARYILFPAAYKTPPREARSLFLDERDRILTLLETLDRERLTTRCLIPRLRGLEDNSRYWSVAMAVEHLTIVGNGIREIIIDLTNGGTQRAPRRIEDVKPHPDVAVDSLVPAFQTMCQDFAEKIELENLNRYPDAKFPHPWFGPMNARAWYILAARHQTIHRQQIESILDKLPTPR